MTTPRAIPSGFVEQPDGSYSKMKTAKQHNMEAGVGEVEICTPKEGGRRTDPVAKTLTEGGAPFFAPQRSEAEQSLNKTEKAWLSVLRGRGLAVRVQAVTLRLANKVRYTPDFSAVSDGRYVFWEVKGAFVREDAWIKLKTAASLYPEFTFILAQKKRGWTEKEIKP